MLLLHLVAAHRDWREAVRVCYQYARPDLIPTVVAPAAAASAAGLLSEAKEACERISKYLSRLSEVRAKREALDAALKAAQGRQRGGRRGHRQPGYVVQKGRKQSGSALALVCREALHWHLPQPSCVKYPQLQIQG
jgi:hypothetical protein